MHMVTRKKAKASPKRRKAPAKRPALRSKAVKRARKPARKAPLRRAAPKAAKRKVVTPKAVKRKVVAPKAARPQVAIAPERPVPGERIGAVTHFYGAPSVAIVKLETGTLRIGDTIHFQGHTTDFSQRVESLQVEHAPVDAVGPSDDFGVKVTQQVREHDVVYKVAS
jgi:putative protease